MRPVQAVRAAVAAVALCGCSLAQPRFTPADGTAGERAALTAGASRYDFGTAVLGGAAAAASFTFTNTGSAATGELAPATLSGEGAAVFALGSDGCGHRVLAPSASCTVLAMMAPSSAGARSAVLSVGGSPGGTATTTLSGTVVEPGALRISPPAIDFGSVATGAAAAVTTFTVTNTGGSSSGLVAATISGSDAAQFPTAADRCTGAILAPGGTCTIQAWFAPGAPGAHAGSLTVASAAAGTAVASLAGDGLAPAAVAASPQRLDFGPVVVGAASAPLVVTFTNAGQQPSGVVQIALTGAGAAQYRIAMNGCNIALDPARSCSVSVVFAPGAAGDAAAALTASPSPAPVEVSLAGTGIPPAALTFVPASSDYGVADVGTASAPVAFALQNTGGQTTSALATSLVGGNAGDYAIIDDACNGRTLASGAMCSITVAFAPRSFGPRAATLRAAASTGGITTASLSGTARDKLTLTVVTGGGSGSGTVTSSAGPLACAGTTCTASYYRGTALTLTAVPDPGSIFGGWSGPCSGTATCALVLDANLTATATFLPGTQDLTFAAAGLAGATGAIDVAASPAGASCGAGCLRFPTGTRVTLTARPAAGYYLGTWSGDCVGNGLSCVLDLTASRAATATFSPANLAFITSGKFVPSPVDPVAWADRTCQAAAEAAGLPGKYVGWINDSAAGWSTRLGSASGWVRLDGKPFAASKPELLAGHSLYPNRVDEHGTAVPMTTLVNSGGGGYDCMGWTQTLSSGLRQVPGLAGGGWGQAGIYDWYDTDNRYEAVRCGTPLSLHCLEVDYNVNLTYARASGRTAFVAVSHFVNVPNGSGLAGLDSFCNTAAAAAGLAGTYRALVATTTASAAARFSTSGAPWIRSDGVPIVAQASDLFAAGGPNMLASLDVDERGAAAFAIALAGAPDLNALGTPATTCNNYTDSTTTTNDLIVGYGTFVNDPALFGYAHSQCASGGSVYCLQQ